MEKLAVKALGLKDAALGKLFTAGGFDTPPSNLANATDGNPSNPCGTGQTVKGSAGTVGYFDVDLGSDKPRLISPGNVFAHLDGDISVFKPLNSLKITVEKGEE